MAFGWPMWGTNVGNLGTLSGGCGCGILSIKPFKGGLSLRLRDTLPAKQ